MPPPNWQPTCIRVLLTRVGTVVAPELGLQYLARNRRQRATARTSSSGRRAIELLGLQRRIVDVPFLSSTVKGVRIRHVEGCADLQPLRQVWVSQERFAE